MHILPYLVKDSFYPTEAMITAAETLLKAIVYEQIVRPKVIAYKVKILAQMRPKVSRQWVKLGDEDRIILDPSQDYLLSCKAFKIYHRRCTKEGRKLGFVFKPNSCPLLRAENARLDAQTMLVEAMQSFSGLSKDDLFHRYKGFEAYNQYIKDSLYLLTPFCQAQSLVS